METIGERIKTLRKGKNLKQGELAKRLKMTSAQLCRIEGSKNAPSVKTLARIAKALEISLSDLMSVEENLAAKYKTYASITQDAELRAKYEQISDTHKKHYDALLANLK